MAGSERPMGGMNDGKGWLSIKTYSVKINSIKMLA
jgi:hypothetical protein